jgi:hypothetical protein
MRQLTRTAPQEAVVQQLVEKWKLDRDKILFLNPNKPTEPWLNYDALTIIARGSGRFRSLSEHYSTFIQELKHVIHTATVVDSDGIEYTRSGAAAIGERLFADEEVDEHSLAATRALRSALDSAGFDVVKASSVIDLNLPREQHTQQDEANARVNDLRQLHAIAARKGLIVPSAEDESRNDMTEYRAWLAEHFHGAGSAAGFTAAERAIAINLLRQLPDAERVDLRTQ